MLSLLQILSLFCSPHTVCFNADMQPQVHENLDVSYDPVCMPMHMPADSEDVNIVGFCDKTALAKIQYQLQYDARKERMTYSIVLQ